MLINTDDSTQHIGVKEDGQPLQAFIVDDSIAMVKILSRTMSDFGVSIVGSANDGNDAIKKLGDLQNAQIDLICLDITMPNKDGLTALPDIKRLKPKSKIVMVSALGDKNRVLQSMQLGADYYIVKPFKKETVYAVVRKLFSK